MENPSALSNKTVTRQFARLPLLLNTWIIVHILISRFDFIPSTFEDRYNLKDSKIRL